MENLRQATSKMSPLNSLEYASGLTHLGRAVARAGSPSAILVRKIPKSILEDGMGPWPYTWINARSELISLQQIYHELVTITLVTQPGYIPVLEETDAIYLKDHFLYDPTLPHPTFRKRTRKHLRRASGEWEFELTSRHEDGILMYVIYQDLKRRRSLSGGFFDFPRSHFERLATLRGALFFRASDQFGVAAMACSVEHAGWIQMIHFVISDRGLRSDVAYFLMEEILNYAKSEMKIVNLGGTPSGFAHGVERFKARWSNRREPVFLHRIVNSPETYEELASTTKSHNYFPSYRSPAQVSFE
jgi:hypothetical protein